MMQIVDAGPERYDIRSFLTAYSGAVTDFGESIPPNWIDDRLSAISSGEEFCIGAVEDDQLSGILSYSYADRKGYSFACWADEDVDREGLILLIREFANRSPEGMKLRISGLHPNISMELMSAVAQEMGFTTSRRFEMTAVLDESVEAFDAPSGLTTVPLTKYNEVVLARLDWSAFQGTADATLFSENEEENRKLFKSLLSGDFGPVLSDASLCVLRDGEPCALIAVTDMGDAAFVADIAVLPDMKGKGTGRFLLVNAMKAARKMRKQRMSLWVSEGNTPALALYKSLGFGIKRTGVYYMRESK